MSMNKQLSQGQTVTLLSVTLLLLGLLLWNAIVGRIQSVTTRQGVEVAPVQEVVVAGERPPVTAAPTGQLTDEQARRREALESMKWSAQHQR